MDRVDLQLQREKMTTADELGNQERTKALSLKQWSVNQERSRTSKAITKEIDSGYFRHLLITKGRADMRSNFNLFGTS